MGALPALLAGAGAEVAIVARRSELLDTARFEIKQKTGVTVACVPGDVSTADGCQAAYEAARESMGQVDVLVNNACLNPKFGKKFYYKNTSLEKFPLNNWDKEIKVGLTGAFLCSKIF